MFVYSILILILLTFDGSCSQETLGVFTNVEDTLESQRQCVKNSRSSRFTYRRKDCICDSQHSTAMSEDGGHFGCYSAKEVGCNYNLAGSDQAYLVQMTAPYRDEVVEVAPKLQDTSIKEVLVWNLKDSTPEIGSWFDITEEGRTIFSIDNKSSLMISSNRAWWNGHVVRIHFENQNYQSKDQDDELINSTCIVVKFNGYPDPYPFDLLRWRNRIPKPSKMTTASPGQPTTTPITTTPMKPSHVTVITTTTTITNVTTIRDNEIRTTVRTTITTATIKPNKQPKITTNSTSSNTTTNVL